MAEVRIKPTSMVTGKRAGWAEKSVSLVLLFILLTAASAGVSVVLTGPDWALLWESLLFGLLIGWALAILHWPTWRSALIIIAAGILFSLLFAGGVHGKILAVFAELIQLAGRAIRALYIGGVDLTPLGGQIQELFTATGVVLGRVITWLSALATGQSIFDPVAAGFVWSIVVWLVAAWAGWVVEAGRNALLAVLPALLLNLSTLSYGRYSSASIYLILGSTLVLIGIVQYEQREQEWNDTKIAYPARKGRQMGNASLIFAILLVLLSAFISSLSLQRIVNWASEVRRSSGQPESGLAKSLGILPAATATPNAFTKIRTPGLPRDFLIGSGPELSWEQVMSMQVIDLASLVGAGHLPPLYWRSFTYDIYTGHGWSSSVTEQNQYQPDQPIQQDQLPDHLLIREVVRQVPGRGGTIYATGEPVRVNVPSNAAWRSSSDLFGIQTESTGYDIQSLIPIATESNLRAAGQDYPKWIVQRYLALPMIPNRVKELAIELTATEPTPYDRAHAIEQYLRTYPYTLDVPRPPSNQDLVEFFLFDLRKGYCDYYASAMVVLARAAGIPARLVIGYASGTYNLNSKLFTVTQADAHSWVEVYFPSIGWVPFEPTAAQPPIERTHQTGLVVTPTVPPQVGTPGVSLSTSRRYVGYVGLMLVALVGFGWATYNAIYLRRLQPKHAAVEIYRRMRRYGTLLSVPMEAGETPYEYGASLTSRIQEIVQGRLSLSTSVNLKVQTMITHIVRLSYRPDETGAVPASQIVDQWKALRWWIRLMWVLNIWGSIFHYFSEGLASKAEKPRPQVE